jgi:hypothetical protein
MQDQQITKISHMKKVLSMLIPVSFLILTPHCVESEFDSTDSSADLGNGKDDSNRRPRPGLPTETLVPPPLTPAFEPGAAGQPGTVLIRETFGTALGARQAGNGALKSMFVGNHADELRSLWAEYSSVVGNAWMATAADQSWTRALISVKNDSEGVSRMDSRQNEEYVSAFGGPDNINLSPAALLKFSPPTKPYEVSADFVIGGDGPQDFWSLGFSSSIALTNNFGTNGQAWIRVRRTGFRNSNTGIATLLVELRTNGTRGEFKSMLVDHTRAHGPFYSTVVRYNPMTNMVSATFDGMSVGIIPYQITNVATVGFESSPHGGGTDNFTVRLSN